jgi:hypothetical protein
MKFSIIHIVFLFISGLCLAQKPMVLLDIDPKEAEPGEILTVTVKSNIQGELDIELPTGFVHGYNVMNGMEQEMDYNTGKLITYYYMSQTGAMNKEGTFTFGPAYIKKGSKVYRSNTVSVTIKKEVNSNQYSDEITNKQLKQPAFGVIETSKKTIYEGEPVVFNAKVYAHFSPSHLENYQGYSISGVIDKHDVGNNQRILVEETKFKGIRLYTFTYDKNVVFPTGTGKIDVDPYKLILRRGYESVPITSSGTLIEVKPLPSAPSDFAGGVGVFSIERTINGSSFDQGEVFTMTITISGTGNIHNLLEPKLQLPKGFIVYGDPVVKEELTFTSKGAEGNVTYTYNIQITTFGDLEIPGTTFSYFDPQKEKYIRISSNDHHLQVKKDIHFKADPAQKGTENTFVEKQKISPMRTNASESSSYDVYNSPIFWVGIGSPFVLALILGFSMSKRAEKQSERTIKNEVKKSKEKTNDLLNSAKIAFDNGDLLTYYSLLEKSIQRSVALLIHGDEHVSLSKQDILVGLQEMNIDEMTISRLKLILERCEQARFGMGVDLSETKDLTESVNDTLQSLHRS